MNNNNGREMKILVVAALIISIVAIGIGFAAFSETLTINGSASVQTSTWKVKFSELGTATLTGSAAEVTKPTLSDTTIGTYNATFKTPGDSVSYKIKVSNTGSYNAKITTATISVPSCTGKAGEATADADATKVCDKLTYTLVYDTDDTQSAGQAVAVGDTLKAGETRPMVLTLKYAEFTDATLLPAADVSISNLGVTLVYSQAE